MSPHDDNVVWGTNKHHDIYRWNKNNWQHIPGKLKQVTAGEAGVWGVASNGHIFYREGTYGGAVRLESQSKLNLLASFLIVPVQPGDIYLEVYNGFHLELRDMCGELTNTTKSTED